MRAWLRKDWVILMGAVVIGAFSIFFAVKLYQATQWELLKTWNASYEIGEGVWSADIVAEWETDIFMGHVSETEADILVDFFVFVRMNMYSEEWVRTDTTCSHGQFVERMA